jgi:hypothetical protein
MPLSLNEIKSCAIKFSKDWEDVSDECAESQTFLNEFFEVFGISRRRVATFEKPVRKIDGKLESRFRYSNDIVYNNFPWPENPTEKQIKTVEEKAQKVLDVRKEFPDSSLADLYDPLTMPPALVKAHQELDKAVDLCCRPQPFPNETKRIEFLFELYEKYAQPLMSKPKGKKKLG